MTWWGTIVGFPVPLHTPVWCAGAPIPFLNVWTGVSCNSGHVQLTPPKVAWVSPYCRVRLIPLVHTLALIPHVFRLWFVAINNDMNVLLDTFCTSCCPSHYSYVWSPTVKIKIFIPNYMFWEKHNWSFRVFLINACIPHHVTIDLWPCLVVQFVILRNTVWHCEAVWWDFRDVLRMES